MNVTTIKQLHEYYQTASLLETAQYARTLGFRVTRQALSRMFRELDLDVRTPNGHDPIRQRSRYLTPYHHIAARAIEIAMADIAAYRRGTGRYIDYLSACYFFTTERFRDLVEGLKDAAGLDVQLELPVGVTMSEVLEARQKYLEACQMFLAPEEYPDEL